MKSSIHTRLPKKLAESTQQVNQLDLEDLILRVNGKCPVCDQAWPKKAAPKVHVGFRVPDKILDVLKPVANNSRYLSAILSVFFGYCPVCEQKK